MLESRVILLSNAERVPELPATEAPDSMTPGRPVRRGASCTSTPAVATGCSGSVEPICVVVPSALRVRSPMVVEEPPMPGSPPMPGVGLVVAGMLLRVVEEPG